MAKKKDRDLARYVFGSLDESKVKKDEFEEHPAEHLYVFGGAAKAIRDAKLDYPIIEDDEEMDEELADESFEESGKYIDLGYPHMPYGYFQPYYLPHYPPYYAYPREVSIGSIIDHVINLLSRLDRIIDDEDKKEKIKEIRSILLRTFKEEYLKSNFEYTFE